MAAICLENMTINSLERTDLSKVSKLIKGMRPYTEDRVRLRDFSEAYYHWMYHLNPAGKGIVYTAEMDGKVAASFAMAPKRFQMGTKTETIGKTMEAFTTPRFQGMGLMKKVSHLVFEKARESGIAMWYVTPSKNSYPIFLNRWGYQETFENYYMMCVLRPSALLGSLGILGKPLDLAASLSWRRSSKLKSYEVKECVRFGPEADEVWDRSKGKGNMLIRDRAYLNWRYCENPDPYIQLVFYLKNQPLGILVLKHTLRKGLKVGEVVDFVCPLEDVRTRRAMLVYGVKRLHQDGCVIAQTWAIKNSSMEKQLKQAGFTMRRKKLPVLLSPGAPVPEFYNKEAWFLTQGDGNDL